MRYTITKSRPLFACVTDKVTVYTLVLLKLRIKLHVLRATSQVHQVAASIAGGRAEKAPQVVGGRCTRIR